MTVNRPSFFDAIRKTPFPGKISQTQVSGCLAILDEFERRGMADLRWLSYPFGTTYHETAHTMQPIHEFGDRTYFNKYEPGTKIGGTLGNTVAGDGYLFRGRGYVQLTGRANYKKMSDILRVDLIANPDLALNPGIAAKIMLEGMTRGTFTGKKLADYFNASLTDWTNARRIINGTDKATLIAGYAKQFHAALNVTVPAAVPPPDVPPVQAKPSTGWLAALLSRFSRKA